MFWDDKNRKYALEYEVYLRTHYKEKDDYEKLLTNLEHERLEKSVKEENYISLKNEYTAKLQETRKSISKLKFQITSFSKKCSKDIEKIDSQIEQIKLRHKVGEYSEEKLKESLLQYENERHQFESLINELKRIHALKVPKDIPYPSTAKEKLKTELCDTKELTSKPPSKQISITAKHYSEIAAPTGIEEKPPILQTPITKKPQITAAKKSPWILASATICVILIVGFIIWQTESIKNSQSLTPKIGGQAPNFVLPDINGKNVSLQYFRGKQVVLYLWNVNCPLCKNDLMWIQELSNCSNDKIIEFLTINTMDGTQTIAEYLNKYKYNFSVLIDFKGNIFKQYSLRNAVPWTAIIDSEGKIKNINIGAFQNKEELRLFAQEDLSSPFDKTPPQISEINISNPSILSWKTDKETHSALQGIRGDVEVNGWDIADNWTMYHIVDITNMSAYNYDKIKIISTDYCGNTASEVITLNNCLNVGCRAPDFIGSSTDSQETKLSAVNSKMTLLHFWLLGCGACEKELPLIQRLYDMYSRKQVEILAVNVRGDRYSIADFVTENGYRFNILLDTEGTIDALYANPNFPTTFLLDENKRIIKKHEGAFQSYQEMTDFIGPPTMLPDDY